MQFVTIEEAASRFHYRKSYLYKLARSGKIPVYKPRGKLLFETGEIDNFIKSGKRVASIQKGDRL